MERTLVTVWKLKQEGRDRGLVQPQLGMCIAGNSIFLPLCLYLWMRSKILVVLILLLQINFREEVDSQIQNSWKLRIDCVYIYTNNFLLLYFFPLMWEKSFCFDTFFASFFSGNNDNDCCKHSLKEALLGNCHFSFPN